MSEEAIYVAPPPPLDDPAMENKQGNTAIRDVSSFMIMDNLEIRPFSTVSAAALLKDLKLEDSNLLEERIVEIGTDEVSLGIHQSSVCCSDHHSYSLDV